MTPDETITYNLRVDSTDARVEVAELNKLLTTYVALSRRLGLPPELDLLIRKCMQGKIAIQTLMRAIQLFYATTGPFGWLIALGGFALGTLMLADTMEMGVPEY